ncbi:MAG: polyamine aminopropyltransferase [Candidatus Riflebacteria bacterium]|nr:polyamine aminopropyltransferase [Candidatus Riflebacteria bacterium]
MNTAGVFLLFSVFLIAVCGIIYELLAGTISSYLLGDSVFQFSLAIGIFMSSMGLGSYISRFIKKDLIEYFVLSEIALGILGGLSSIILFLAFSKIDNYMPFLFIVSISIGTLVGLELPLALRIMKQYTTMRLLISNVMTADYIGALCASLLFPLVLVPRLGLIRTSLMFGMMNVFVGGAAIYVFRSVIKGMKFKTSLFIGAFSLLLLFFVFSEKISAYSENVLYKDDIIYAVTTPYQRVIITRFKDDIRMFINGSIQFCSRDEYRYHESLVHPAMSAAKNREKVLIVGGGDGLAVREVLKYPDVKNIFLVDIDNGITDFCKSNPLIASLNCNSLSDSKVQIINLDAWKFIENSREIFDVIIIDLPDPDDSSLSRLYSVSFYRLLVKHLSKSGIVATQATSPLYSRKAFWCVRNTMNSIESPYQQDKTLNTYAYHAYIPTFGEWGFVMASPLNIQWENIEPPAGCKFLTKDNLKGMVVFSPDMDYMETELNTLNTQKIKTYYHEGWKQWHL